MDTFSEIVELLRPWFDSIWIQMASLILVATLHGYGAAWLAVRMLFRPRHPFKILGVTLFPQGMIPRHRERLATTIGKAVGDELVSQETILDELLGKEFLRRKISEVVDSYTDDLLTENYPSLIEALPQSLREPVLDSITSLQFKVAEHIEEVLKSEESLKAVHGIVEHRVDEVLSQRVAEVIDDETFDNIVDFFDRRIAGALNSRTLEEKVNGFVSQRIGDLAQSDIRFGELFTPEALGLLKEKANEQIEPIAHHLTEIAAEERTREQIGSLIKREVHSYYETLPFFKKIFVSRENLLGEVDVLVNESLPHRIEETLKGDFFAIEARSFLNTSIDNMMRRPLRELIDNVSAEQLERLKEQVASAVLSLVRGKAMRSQIKIYVTETLSGFRPHSIDSILRTIYPESEAKLKNALANGLNSVIARPETSRVINEMLARQIDQLLSAPIGRASDHISEERLRAAGDSVANTVGEAIREKLPEAIREFDVGGVVREKVMNYPVEKLEELVLSVAKEHLRTIELFGALFGFFIGLGQAIPVYLFHIYSK